MFLVITLTRIFEQLFCPPPKTCSAVHSIRLKSIRSKPDDLSITTRMLLASSPQLKRDNKNNRIGIENAFGEYMFVSIHLLTFRFDLTFLKDAIFRSGSLLQRGAISFHLPTFDLIFAFCTKNTFYTYIPKVEITEDFALQSKKICGKSTQILTAKYCRIWNHSLNDR